MTTIDEAAQEPGNKLTGPEHYAKGTKLLDYLDNLRIYVPDALKRSEVDRDWIATRAALHLQAAQVAATLHAAWIVKGEYDDSGADNWDRVLTP